MSRIPVQGLATETPVALHNGLDAHTHEEFVCDQPGPHVVVELKAFDYWLCRSRIRGLGQCNTEVLLEDTGMPPDQCPRCRQPFPWHGTMEIS